ncbi:uncharacterized protein C8R40DRAFT_10644 [Lentinula edodes]|uniref:uncharacterized protein n=1 Tax=Lentinula edodes TaxID=5353 RepID=UPI001E8E0BDF|nr:uncharacterized protein C8R40DRAFT_10644 [Lentinula edodes]KAH7881011.1 hypothetical protein C8R40DRAFT_10644 [Lentinula edodes]
MCKSAGSRELHTIKVLIIAPIHEHIINVPFGVTYEKIGTIQRRLAWPLHKDDTLSRSGRSTDLNIYFAFCRENPVLLFLCRGHANIFSFCSNFGKSSSLRRGHGNVIYFCSNFGRKGHP